jgi:hypothetical protein
VDSRIILALVIIVLVLMFLGCWDVHVHTRAPIVGKEVSVEEVVQINLRAHPAAHRLGSGSGRGVDGVDVTVQPHVR